MFDKYKSYDHALIIKEARDKFDIRITAKKYLDIYEMVINNPGKKF